ENFRLDAAAQAVASELQLAKIQAIKKNSSVSIAISSQNSTWGISGQSVRSLSSTITFGATTAAAVTFNSRGHSTNSGTLIITLNNSQSQSRTITVESSGRINVSS